MPDEQTVKKERNGRQNRREGLPHRAETQVQKEGAGVVRKEAFPTPRTGGKGASTFPKFRFLVRKARSLQERRDVPHRRRKKTGRPHQERCGDPLREGDARVLVRADYGGKEVACIIWGEQPFKILSGPH